MLREQPGLEGEGPVMRYPQVPPWPFETEELYGGVDENRPRMDFGPSFSGGRRDTLTPQEARVKWLEREVEALKGLMQDQVKRETSTYWDHTFPTKISSEPPAPWEKQRSEEIHREVMRQFNQMEDRRQRGSRDLEDRTEDALRSFPITLPKLASPGERNSALLAGDWLTQIKPLISDVSTKAGHWWDVVLSKTLEKYGRWLAASPLTGCGSNHLEKMSFHKALTD